MKAFVLIVFLLGHHTHHTSETLAEAIDVVCEEDAECILDAVATCYVETRCQLGHCGRNGCGPFQQLARYSDHPELAEMSNDERREALNSDDPRIAAEQWKRKRDRYARRFGERWPVRYNGSSNKEEYFASWQRTRERALTALRR